MPIAKMILPGVFFYFVFLILLPLKLIAADKINGYYLADSITFRVEWIGQISSTDNFSEKESFSDMVLNFLFGENKQRLFRPISVITTGNGTLFVLDQGSQSLVKIDEREGEIISKSHFPSLVGMCFNENDDLLFTDSALEKIFIQADFSEEARVLNDTLTFLLQ